MSNKIDSLLPFSRRSNVIIATRIKKVINYKVSKVECYRAVNLGKKIHDFDGLSTRFTIFRRTFAVTNDDM